jgi:hypothetical protein
LRGSSEDALAAAHEPGLGTLHQSTAGQSMAALPGIDDALEIAEKIEV